MPLTPPRPLLAPRLQGEYHEVQQQLLRQQEQQERERLQQQAQVQAAAGGGPVDDNVMSIEAVSPAPSEQPPNLAQQGLAAEAEAAAAAGARSGRSGRSRRTSSAGGSAAAVAAAAAADAAAAGGPARKRGRQQGGSSSQSAGQAQQRRRQLPPRPPRSAPPPAASPANTSPGGASQAQAQADPGEVCGGGARSGAQQQQQQQQQQRTAPSLQQQQSRQLQRRLLAPEGLPSDLPPLPDVLLAHHLDLANGQHSWQRSLDAARALFQRRCAEQRRRLPHEPEPRLLLLATSATHLEALLEQEVLQALGWGVLQPPVPCRFPSLAVQRSRSMANDLFRPNSFTAVLHLVQRRQGLLGRVGAWVRRLVSGA